MTKDQIEKAIADAEALAAKLREMLPIAPAEPSYLPTRYINVKREKYNDSFYATSFAYESRIGERRNHPTHILHDMPADKDGVQVDFVTLTEAGYVISISADGNYRAYFDRNKSGTAGQIGCDATAIDAWRAAAVHYLANKK